VNREDYERAMDALFAQSAGDFAQEDLADLVESGEVFACRIDESAGLAGDQDDA
jgi:hypothetical protein